MLPELVYYARAASGLARFVRTPPLADPASVVRAQLERRESAFLDTMRAVVFADPGHPYARLLRHAGCEAGDLEAALRRDGLEAALEALRRAGVYLTHDEFKGKLPIRRGALELSVRPESFENPRVRGALETATSGSRSPGTKTQRSVEFLLYREALDALLLQRLGLADRPRVGLYHSLPAMSGLMRSLSAAREGVPMERWFSVAGDAPGARAYRAMTSALIREARLLGTRACAPTYLPPNDFGPAAEWLARRRAQSGPRVVIGGVSRAVRVASAAAERGLDLGGTAFVASGEALTPAKRAVIERAGAEAFSLYVMVEIGPIGMSCRNLREDNAVHVARDSVAVIGRRRPAPLSDTEVDSLLFTTLLPTAPLVLVNVEMDDAGRLESAACDCPLGAFGYSQRIRGLYSYGKLTGHSATLEGSDLLRILEEGLPARFGGDPTDYQLVEREGPDQTLIELRVNPRLSGVHEDDVRAFFLAQVRRLWGGSLIRREWLHTGALVVRRAAPIPTVTGKILPLHLLGGAAAGPDPRRP